jgi:hypothetical protein
VNLYSDAEGDHLKPIDWENKFSEWITATEDVYSISDLIYSNPDIQSFWAWDFRDYLAGKYVSVVQPYPVGPTFALPTSTLYESSQCESDRMTYCPTLPVYYAENTDLFYCLTVNAGVLSAGCSGFLAQITSEFVYPFAEQIFLQDFTGNPATAGVSGLYVRPSGSSVQVYTKYPNNDGYIYQPACAAVTVCPWIVLDSSYQPIFTGLATPVTDVQPSTAGWTDYTTGKHVQVFHLYFDFIINVLEFDRPPWFLFNNIPAQSVFQITGDYVAGDPAANTAASREIGPVQLLMSGFSTYKTIMLDVNGDNATCTSYNEASELCNSFRDQTQLGHTECGSQEGGNPVDERKPISEWFTGACNDSWTIMAIDEDLVSDGTVEAGFNSLGCNCDDPSAWNPDVVNLMNTLGGPTISALYMSPYASQSNFFPDQFGGRIEPNSSAGQCGQTDSSITLQCSAEASCLSMDACIPEFVRLGKITDRFYQAFCDSQLLLSYVDQQQHFPENYQQNSRLLAACVMKDYPNLSQCCRTALDDVGLLNLDTTSQGGAWYTCERLFQYTVGSTIYDTALEASCNRKDRCQFTSGTPATSPNDCLSWCYGDVWSDCQSVSDRYFCGVDLFGNMTVDEEQQAYFDCVSQRANKDFTRNGRSGPSCCKLALNAVGNTYENCTMPVNTFSFTTFSYDYSACSAGFIASVGCDAGSLNGTSELACLQTEVMSSSIFTAALFISAPCCTKAVIASINTFSFTAQCEGDFQNYCGASASKIAYANALGVPEAAACMAGIGQAAQLGALSGNCAATLFGACAKDGAWPITPLTAVASLACDTGFTGTQTRTCRANPTTTMAEWLDADVTGCVPVSCATEDYLGVTWPQTLGGYIATVKGSENTQELIDVSNAYCTTCVSACAANDTSPLAMDWYTRRKCTISGASASWDAPSTHCRPTIPSASWGYVSYPTSTCDMFTSLFEVIDPRLAGFSTFFGSQAANLIAALPASYVGLTNLSDPRQLAAFMSTSQQACDQLFTNCGAFTFDAVTGISYFFDWCPMVSEDRIYGVFAFYVAAGIQAQVAPVVIAAVNQGVVDQVTQAYTPTFTTNCANALDAVYGVFCPALDVTCCVAYYLNATATGAIAALDPSVYDSAITDYMATISATVDAAAQSGWLDAQIAAGAFPGAMTTYIAPLNTMQYTAQFCSVMNGLAFTPSEAWSPAGIPRPECFNNTLWAFFFDPLGGVLILDKIEFKDNSQVYNPAGIMEVQIESTFNGIALRGIDDDQIAVEFILAIRDRLAIWHSNQLYVIPGGLVINLYSQYIGVEESLGVNLAYVSIAIILCGAIFLLNPIAVIVALLCNVAMIVEVYGFCDWLGLRINGVLILNVVIAIGLTMEFTAHMARAFVLTTSEGAFRVGLPFADEGQIRLKKTLREMFTPVSLGALTTLLGVAPISAAKFPYFRQYYFTLYVMIVFFGWINGVIFQPIILSLYPPAPFLDDSELLNELMDGPEEDGDAETDGNTTAGGETDAYPASTDAYSPNNEKASLVGKTTAGGGGDYGKINTNDNKTTTAVEMQPTTAGGGADYGNTDTGTGRTTTGDYQSRDSRQIVLPTDLTKRNQDISP